MVINPEQIPVLEEILWEFMDSKPESSKDWGDHNREATYLVTPSTVNPEWYRNMCKAFPRGIDKHNRKGPNKKKPRTIVKRKHTIVVMENMIKNSRSDSKYAPYIMDEVKRRSEIPLKNESEIEWNGQF